MDRETRCGKPEAGMAFSRGCSVLGALAQCALGKGEARMTRDKAGERGGVDHRGPEDYCKEAESP